MTGLKATPSQETSRPEYLANPFLTEAQRAEADMQSVFEKRRAAGEKQDSAADKKGKRSSATQMALALSIVIGCMALIAHWAATHLFSALPIQNAPTNLGQVNLGQPNLGQPGFAQPGFSQPGLSQPGFSQPGFGQTGFNQSGFSPASLIGSALTPRKPISSGFQPGMGHLAPAGFHSYGMQRRPVPHRVAHAHSVTPHITKPAVTKTVFKPTLDSRTW